MHEIEEVQAKIDALRQRPLKQPLSMNNLSMGILFFILFLLSITRSGVFFDLVAFVSFAMLTIFLFLAVADMLARPAGSLSYVLAAVFLLLIGISYFGVWTYALASYAVLIQIILMVIVVLVSLFYLLHAYLAYLRNTSRKECMITGGIVLATWLFILISFLYQNMLTFFLLFVAVLISSKTVFDFSQRFVKRN